MQTTLSTSFEKYVAEKPKTYFSLLPAREMRSNPDISQKYKMVDIKKGVANTL
jgi:hypothetical protein